MTATGRALPDGDQQRRRAGQAAAVGDGEADRVRAGSVNVCDAVTLVASVTASPLKSQAKVNVSLASASLDARPSNDTASGASPSVGTALASAIGGVVAGDVLEAPNGSVEVDVVDVAIRTELDVDGVRGCGFERQTVRRVRIAVCALEHHPDAVAGVVGEEQRAVVRRRVVAATVERQARDRRAARRAPFACDDGRAE